MIHILNDWITTYLMGIEISIGRITRNYPKEVLFILSIGNFQNQNKPESEFDPDNVQYSTFTSDISIWEEPNEKTGDLKASMTNWKR